SSSSLYQFQSFPNLLLIMFAIFLSIPFHWITKIEETLLIDQFGDEYLEYMKATGRFIPRMR
ncbi:MAG: methyltransferase family protein, partial [Promethearchaeota archaeon]